MSFTGFEAADFDAFLPKKQRSNAYTLERRRAKEKLVAVARRVLDVEPEAVLGLDLETTEDAPSVANGRRVGALAAYFVRPAAVRTGLKELLATNLQDGAHLFDIAVHQQHAHLELRIEHAGLAIGVRLPAGATVDRKNFSEKLALDWAREEWTHQLQSLPAGARVGFEGDLVPCAPLADERVAGWAREIDTRDAPFLVETSIPRDEAESSGASWLDEGARLLASFSPVLAFVAWSRQNDHSRVEETVAKKLEEGVQRAPSLSPGARVTILGGLFAGRNGYVVEIDHKAKAKVMVGPVTITVDANELKPSG